VLAEGCEWRGVSTEAIMSSHQPQGPGNGPPSAGIPMQHQQGVQQPPAPAQSMSQQNLNQIVRPYLLEFAILSGGGGYVWNLYNV